MLKATKKNRVVRILDEDVDKFKSLGYTITTMDGKTVSEPVDLEAENAKLRKENALLKQRVFEMELTLKDYESPALEQEDDEP